MTSPKRELLAAYRTAGGDVPCRAEVALCAAKSAAGVTATARRYFRRSAPGGSANPE